MSFTLRPYTKRDVWLHLVIIISSLAILVLGFFYVYLPWTTHHGQTVTVPNLQGKTLASLDDFLGQYDLEYLVDDSTYNPDQPPLTVYQQYPPAGELVKTGRKVFVYINAKRPAMVKMPSLVSRSLLNAQAELETYGLKLGEIEYVPDLQVNAVLKQRFQGKEIASNAEVPKGSKIDLVVGDGLGNQEFEVPDLSGKSKEEAEFALSGMNLTVGTVIYQDDAGGTPGTVTRQSPNAGKKIRVGQMVDLWIAGPTPGANPSEAPDEAEDPDAEPE